MYRLCFLSCWWVRTENRKYTKRLLLCNTANLTIKHHLISLSVQRWGRETFSLVEGDLKEKWDSDRSCKSIHAQFSLSTVTLYKTLALLIWNSCVKMNVGFFLWIMWIICKLNICRDAFIPMLNRWYCMRLYYIFCNHWHPCRCL